jgi:N-acetylglucosaminyldiphosphoundecaprenol N-acetyl-beta-D-mannosaminyltransferase
MIKTKKNHAYTGRKIGQILGINVTSTSVSSLLTCVEDFIAHNHRFYIVTPNPELILASQKNKELKEAMNNADLPVPDGVGLKIANPALTIIKGRELFLELIKLAEKRKWKVFLLGGLEGEAAKAASQLKIKNLKLKIATDMGPILENSAEATGKNKRLETETIEKINKFAPELLFVAFGNPKQEIWIHKNLSKLNIGGAMAVGGTFRYIAGITPLPPKWMAKAGLEWLWRLLTEPSRLERIFNAVFVFPLKVLLSRFFARYE